MSTRIARRPALLGASLLTIATLWIALRVVVGTRGVPPVLFWSFLVVESVAFVRVGVLGLRLHVADGTRRGTRRSVATTPTAAAGPGGPGATIRDAGDLDVAVLVRDGHPDRTRLSLLSAARADGVSSVLLVGSADERTDELAAEFGARRVVAPTSTDDAARPTDVALAIAALDATAAARLAFVSSDSVLHHEVDSLTATAFQDPSVAWVQSMARSAPERDVLHTVENDLVGVVDGENGVAPWSIDASVVRTDALRGVLAADATSGHAGAGAPRSADAWRVDLLASGWRGAWSTVSLAIANGAERGRHDADIAAAAGRLRTWCSRRSSWWVRGLSVRARIAALSTWFEDVRGLVGLALLAVVISSLLTGQVPVSLDLWGLLVAGAALHAVNAAVRWQLTGRRIGPLSTARTTFEAIDPSIAAVCSMLAGRVVGADRSRVHVAFVAAVALQLALVTRAVSEVIGWPLSSPGRAQEMVALTAGVAATVPLLRAIDVIVPVSLRRSSARVAGEVRVDLDGEPVDVLDLAPSGVGVRRAGDALAVGAGTSLLLRVPGRSAPLRVQGLVRSSVLLDDDSHRLGIEFVDMPRATRDELMAFWAAAWIPAAADPRREVALRPVDALKVQVNRRSNPVLRVVAAITLVATGVASLPPYGAAGAATPPLPENTLALTKEVRGDGPAGAPTQGTTLYGAPTRVDLTAYNTWSADDEARERYYNLSFRDVVPPGASYVDGSASIAPTSVLVDQPEKGATTLIWQNLSDAQPGASTSVSYQMIHNGSGADDEQLIVGDTMGGEAEVYANTHPRYVPDFDEQGRVVDGKQSYTQSAAAKGTTTIVPIQIHKSEPSPEHELMRGVHHPTTYTLAVANNLIQPTAKVVVDDYLPAGLEFLGCGTVDHTPDAPGTEGGVEYPGAPRLDESSPHLSAEDGCAAPILVETIEGDPDEDGPLGKGVYTHVRWVLGDLEPGATRTIVYLAGVPERANVMWPTSEPAPADGALEGEVAEDPTRSVPVPAVDCNEKADACEQVANLANNTGELTTAVDGPQRFTNLGTVTGVYLGRLHEGVAADQTWDRSSETVQAEDLAIQKVACNTATNGVDGGKCPNGVEYGNETTWTLRVRTGEYRAADDVVVTDHLPDGLEYVKGSAVLDATGEQIDPDVASGKEGDQLLTWKLGAVKPDTELVLTFRSTTLENYRRTGEPVLVFDTLHNEVDLRGVTSVVTGDDDLGTAEVTDDSGDRLESRWNSVAKTTLSGDAATSRSIEGVPCAAGHTDPVTVTDLGPRFSPGDLVCFELTVDMPVGVRLRDMVLTDFLPANAEYVGWAPYEDHTDGQLSMPEIAPEFNNAVIWNYGTPVDGDTRYTPVEGGRFHVVLGARVSNDPQANNDFDLHQNLLKVAAVGTQGYAPVSPRATSPYLVAQPVLSLTKGVVDVVRGGASVEGYPIASPVAGDDSHPVAGGDVVTYRIDVPNTGVQFRSPGKDPDDPADDVAATLTCRREASTSELQQANQLQQVLSLLRGDETAEEQAARETAALAEQEPTEPSTREDSAVRRQQRRLSSGMRVNQQAGSSCGGAPSRIRDADTAQESAQQTLTLERGDSSLSEEEQKAADQQAAEVQKAEEAEKAAEEQKKAEEAKAAEEQQLQERSQQRLSTGTRINSASDDAAGLEISGDTGSTQAADALAVEIWDVLPEGLGCDAFLRNEEDGNPQGGVDLVLREGSLPLATPPEAKVIESACDTDAHTVRLTVDRIPAGYDLHLFYKVLVPATIGAGSTHHDTAGVRSFTDVTGAEPYFPSDNIDREVAPDGKIQPNSAPAIDDATVTLPAAAVAKSRTTSVTETANDADAQATIGEHVAYTVAVTVPYGTSVYGTHATDTLPSTLALVAGSAKLTLPPDVDDTGFALDEQPSANRWTLRFPDTYTNGAAGNQVVLVTYGAIVTDAPDNTAAATIVNEAELVWSHTPSGGDDETRTAQSSTTVVEPKPTISKSHTPNTNPSTVTGGGVVTYTLKVGNTNGRSPLHDVVVTDCVPAGLTSVTPTGTYASSASVESTPTPCAADATRITWDLTTLLENPTTRPNKVGLQSNETLSLTYTATVVNPAAGDASLVNNAKVTGSSLGGTVAGERTSYSATTSDTLKTAKPTITKSVDQPSRLPGESAVYSLTVTVPKGIVTHDLTVVDVLPANLRFDSYATLPTFGSSCASTGTSAHTISRSGQNIGWFLGDVTASGAPCTFVLSYTAHVGSGAAAGNSLKNNVKLLWNLTNRVTDVTTVTGSGFDRNVTSSATVTVVEPTLTLAKAVDDTDRIVEAGQLLGYTLTITNTGTHAAYDVALSDTFPEGLLAPTALGGTCLGSADGTVDTEDRTITWTTLFAGATGLAPGASCTVTYSQTVDAANSGTLRDGGTLKNTAKIPTFFGDPTHSTDGFKTYTGPNAEQQVTTYLPELSLAKFAGANAEVADADVGSPFGWTLVVSNTGKGTAYGVDVSDTLPVNWTVDEGSVAATFSDGSGCAPEADRLAGSVTTTPAAGGDVQRLDLTDLCDLAGNSTLTLTFTATPQVAAEVTPGLVDGDGEKVLHPNLATVDGSDAGGTPLATASDDAAATLRSADLRLIKTDASADDDGDPDSAGFAVGTVGNYYLDVRNVGPDPASGPIVVTDTVPTGLTPVDATGEGWDCDLAGSTVTCTTVGPLAVHANLPRITVGVEVGTDALNLDANTGLVTNTASVTSPSPDPSPEDNSDDEPTPVHRIADLGITKTVDPATPFVPGTNVGYQILVTNQGPSPAAGPVTVTDELPDRLRLVFVSGVGWDCSASTVPVDPSIAPEPGTATVPGIGFSGTTDGGRDDDNGRVSCTRDAAGLGSSASFEPLTVITSVDPSTPAAMTVTNVATVESGADPNATNDSSDSSNDSDPSTVLSIVKDDGSATFTAGQTDGRYYVSVSNTGPSMEAGPVVVTDTIDEHLRLVGVDAPGWDCEVTVGTGFGDGDRGEFSCTWIGLGTTPAAVGVAQSLNLIGVDVAVSPDAVADPRPGAENLVRNRATVQGTTDADAHSDEESTPVVPSASLTIDKSHDTSTAPWPVGSEQQYRLVVGNDGPSGEYGKVTVEDVLPVGLEYRSSEGDGWDCELRTGPGRGPNGTVHCEHGRGSLGATEVLLPAGETLEPIVVDVEVLPEAAPNPQPDPSVTTNEVTNTATAVGVTDSTEASDTDTVAIQPMADLSITKTHEADTFQVGDEGEFTIEVHNDGPNAASGPVEVVDQLPTGLRFVRGEGIGWSCTADDATSRVSCMHADAIGVDETSTITLTVAVDAAAYAPANVADASADRIDTGRSGDEEPRPELRRHQVRNEVAVFGQTPDTNPDNDSDDDVVDIDPLVDLVLTKTHEGDFAVTGTGTFHLVVSNDGPSALPDGTVTVVDTLPAGLVFRSADGDGWDCSVDDAHVVITCTRDGGLAVDDELPELLVVVDVTPAAEPGAVNTAVVSTPVVEVGTENNTASDRVEVVPLSNLTVDKSLQGQLTVGRQAVWRVVVHNDGPSAATDPVVVDELPDVFADVAASGDGFACTVIDRTVTCRRTSPLPAGADAELVVTATVVGGGGSDVTNTAQVSTSTPETSTGDNAASASGIVTQVAAGEQGSTEVGGNSRSQSLPARLAFTGLTVLGILAAGVAFIVGGFLFTGFGRRRRSKA